MFSSIFLVYYILKYKNFILKVEPQLLLVYFCLSTNATNAIFVHEVVGKKLL